MAASRVIVGERVKDFDLPDQNGDKFRLSSFAGKKVLLSFHPLAWTPVCSKQMKSLEDNWEVFKSFNAVPLGLSVDTVPSKKAWAESLGIAHTRLLSDFWPHGEVAKSLGIFRERNGFSERANIVLDGSRKAIFVKVYEVKVLPDLKEIIDFLKDLE